MNKKYSFLMLMLCSFAFCRAQITISEVNYRSANNPNPGDWLELRNIGASAVNLGGYVFTDSTAGNSPFTLPSYNLAAGAYVVLIKDNIAFTTVYPGVNNFIVGFSNNVLPSLGKNGEVLTLKNAANVIMAEAQYLTTGDWPKGANSEGRTLELINQNSNANLMVPQSWRDGCMLGSPGSAPVPCNDAILISEINYNSDSTIDQGEFIELFNNTNSAINLTGWYLQDGKDSVTNKFYFLQNTILNAGEYILVSNDTAALHKFHGVLPNEKGNFTFNLSNGGEIVRIFNPFDVLKFSVHYNDSIPFTDSADGKGYTLELKSKTGYMNEGSNWFAGCKGGSPGVAYSPNCRPIAPLAISNSALNNFSIANYNTEVVINNISNDNLMATLYTITGQVIQTQFTRNGKAMHIKIPQNIQNGMYIIKCFDGKSNASFKIFINK